jgi:2-phosphosulfolactate phosphatase
VPKLDVHYGVHGITPADVSGRFVAVIDVLRASTVICRALDHGARAVIPLDSPDEVVTRAKAFSREDVVLAGERKMKAISGFDLGNSPSEVTREVVEGKTLLLTTTNGTAALLAVTGARDVVVAAYVNFTAVLSMLRAALRGGADVAIICAGRDRQYSLEDAACAGRYVSHVTKRLAGVEPNDAAFASALVEKRFGDNLVRLFETSVHGRALVAAGFGDDLALCAAIDAHPMIPVYHDRQIRKLGPDRER